LAIKSTTSVTYLGATLDQTLSFSEMAHRKTSCIWS